MDFLAESLCGKDFLQLLAQGSGIVAELLRLSNNIPKIFLNPEDEGIQYKDMLFEFEYLRNSDLFEEKISRIPEYEQLEENLFDRYSGLIKRFMDLFESIISYTNTLNKLMKDIDENNANYVEDLEVEPSYLDAAQHGYQQAGHARKLLLLGRDAHLPGKPDPWTGQREDRGLPYPHHRWPEYYCEPA